MPTSMASINLKLLTGVIHIKKHKSSKVPLCGTFELLLVLFKASIGCNSKTKNGAAIFLLLSDRFVIDNAID